MTTHAAGSTHVPFVDARTRTVSAGGAQFVYREIGDARSAELPLVALTHLGANLDSWDPELVDPLAQGRRVILVGYRGVGGSTGAARESMEEMAQDVIAVIRALGLEKVDLFGQSLGGMVAQSVLEQAPGLVDRVILSGTGPRGGVGLTAMTGVMVRGILAGLATFTDPTVRLFFTRTPTGKAEAAAYRRRLQRRTADRDAAVGLGVFRAQLRAVARWGRSRPEVGSARREPALVVHGDGDRLVPPANAEALAATFATAEVLVLPDSGHGVVFQNRVVLTDAALRFLRR